MKWSVVEMTFTDDDLKRLKECDSDGSYHQIHAEELEALIARLELAELKDCNQYHCGHPSCNEWRKVAGK